MSTSTEPKKRVGFRVDHVREPRPLLGRDRTVVEIGRRAAVDGAAVLGQVDELEPLRDHARLARTSRAPVADRVLQIDEEARLQAIIRFVHQHAALLEQRLEALQRHVHHGAEQRVAGRQKLHLRLAGDQRLLERDPRIAVEHGIAAPDQAVALLQHAGHAGDLVAALLAPGDAAAKRREGFAEEGADEVGLEPAHLRPLHLLADGGDGVRVEPFRGQLPLGDQRLDRGDVDRAVDFSKQLRQNGKCPHVGDDSLD